MKTFRLLILLSLLLTAGTAFSQQPRYWSWEHDSKDRDWNAYFTELTDCGIRGILLQTSPERMREVIPIAQRHGVTVYAWMWILNNGGIAYLHPEWLDYNRNGQSLKDHMAYVGYYKFLSPIIPGVRKEIAKRIEEMAQVEGLGGISMDYCRYVDQILPPGLWEGYGIVQDKEYAEWDYGYHPDMIAAFVKKYGYDPSKAEDPSLDSLWLQFRLDKVTEVADMVGDITHKHKQRISASPFPTPSMSRRMVRQDWGKWKLDDAFPMIYQGFYHGDSVWIEDCVRECVQTKPTTGIYCGLYIPDFYRTGEGRLTLTQAMGAALTGGAKGIAFFTFGSMTPDQRAEVKAFIDTH